MSSFSRRICLILAATAIISSTTILLAQLGGPQPGAFQRTPPLPCPTAPQEFEQSGTRYRAVPFIAGLANPWSLTFLPDGALLVTERPGRLRVVRNGALDRQPVSGVPAVWATGQGGLLEV